MIKVKFKDVTREHLQTLQAELLDYANGFKDELQKPEQYDDFMNAVLQIDIAGALWRKFRTKLESGVVNMRFSVSSSEAVILLNVCTNAALMDINPYIAHVGETYKNLIDHQLKSYNTVYLIQQ